MIEIIQQKKSVTDIISGCRWKLTTLKEAAKMMGFYYSTGNNDKTEDIDSFFYGLETICDEMIAQLLKAEENVDIGAAESPETAT